MLLLEVIHELHQLLLLLIAFPQLLLVDQKYFFFLVQPIHQHVLPLVMMVLLGYIAATSVNA